MNNRQLGELIGCTHSMASRLRAGKRLPGPAVMAAIHDRLGIPWETLMTARTAGQVEFGRMLTEHLQRLASDVAA